MFKGESMEKKRKGPVIEYVNRSKRQPFAKRPVVEQKADKLIAALKEIISQVELELAVLKDKYKL